MKNTPEIAPEIRGLLEEIVADPRSAIRLVPRHALRTWFDTGETVRASDVVRTSAERHLVEMHREELAALLREASKISYWKAPVLSFRPVGPDGKPYHPALREPDWRRHALRDAHGRSDESEGVLLLRQCLLGIQPNRGQELARASLSLVPSDAARYYLALAIPWNRPRPAIAILSRLVRRAFPAITKHDALLSLAARTCALGMFNEARNLYRRYTALALSSPYGWICSFNLSCVLGDEESAMAEATGFGKVARPDDPLVIEAQEILKEWARTRLEQLNEARRVSKRLRGRIPDVASTVCRSFET